MCSDYVLRGMSGLRGVMFHMMFVENEDAVRRQIVISCQRAARQEIVHGFVELDAHGRVLMVQQEIEAEIPFLPHADFDGVRNFQQRLHAA